MLRRAVAAWLEPPDQSVVARTATAMAGTKARRTMSARRLFIVDPPPDRKPAATFFPLAALVKLSGEGVCDDPCAAWLSTDQRQSAGVEGDQVPARCQPDSDLLQLVGEEPRVQP